MSEVQTLLKSLGDEVKSLKGELATLKEKAPNQPDPKRLFNIGRGESALGSRGYSFLKAIGLATGRISREDAKLEAEVHDRVNATLRASGYAKSFDNGFCMPFASAFLADEALGREVHELVCAGPAVDPEEVRYLQKSFRKTMSWNADATGGTLVPLAAQGEPIELLRNKAALTNAGASVVPMPPQGSVTFPKQTSASSAYWVGESTTITDSTPGTGSLVLRAKKLAGRVQVPNELFRYSSPAADALVREDLAKVLQLAMDLAGLTGAGSTVSPKGVYNYGSISDYTASLHDVGTNGNGFTTDDFYGMLGKIYAQNAVVNESGLAFIVRPELFFNIVSRRADAVSAGDRKGSFVEWAFDPKVGPVYRAAGVTVVPSNQIAANQTKASSGATLSPVLGGDWSQWLIAMAAAMEIDANRYSGDAWTKDQTDVRAILQVDMGPRHEESFVKADYVRTQAISA